MNTVLEITQIILAILLIVLILMQSKGTGLGTAFGGEIGFYSTKRGFEKILFDLTILISALFIVLSALRLIL